MSYLVFAVVGSFGLYKLLSSRRSSAAAVLSIVAFVLVSCFALAGIFGGFFYGLGMFLLATFGYAIFGLTAIFLSRKAS